MTRPADSPAPEPSSIPVCGIGASAGGVEALQQFFEAVPADLGLAYVVVVHLAPDRKSELPSILGRWTKMPVVQVADHEAHQLRANHVYVIGPDRKLEITDTSVGASAFDQPRGQRTAIDLFFRSLAASHADGFAVVLSGTGTDGALGAKAVKEAGGVVLVQDPSEAAYGDMPRSVIRTGAADLVRPVRELAKQLAELAVTKDRIVPFVRAAEEFEPIPEDEEKALEGVLVLLRKQTGHDFAKYKRTTVLRRLFRRMRLSRQVTVADYLQYLRGQGPEVQALFDDLLISVTTFFRDPDAWAALRTHVIAPLVDRGEAGEPIRAWVPGCATGEEAYSLAILLQEELERRHLHRDFIIFASDVDESALAVAREGVYPRAISADLTDARLERFFRLADDHYRVSSVIRDRVVFAVHSVLRDPPFSRIDLISCRNLLIYLDRELQDQVMAVFRYACRDHAFLFLGASEAAHEDLFEAVDKKNRIFAALTRGGGRRPLPEILSAPGEHVGRPGRESRPVSLRLDAESHAAALEQAAPPSVLVDERGNVLHLSASAARFFQQGEGPLARRVTDLARPELRDELHAVLHRALEDSEPRLSTFVRVTFNGAPHLVAVLAQRRPGTDDRHPHVLVTFLDVGVASTNEPPAGPEPANEMVRELREGLRRAEQRMNSMRDDYSVTTEDLRAANEELQSLNEEYRSTTEELETSKEELQSINEELQTVNHELKIKLEEVSRARSDIENLMAATDVATLFLSPDLHIKQFTPPLREIFNIRALDLDRPIGDLTHNIEYDRLDEDARQVLSTHVPLEREVRSRAGRIFVARVSPYRTASDDAVDGVVMTFIDITAIKGAEAALRESRQRLETELNVTRRLHRMTLAVATTEKMQEALDEIVAAAIELQAADFGDIQLLDRRDQQWRLAARRGFRPSFLQGPGPVGDDEPTSWRRAVQERKACQIPDVTQDPGSKGHWPAAATAGYRAVQSTPLISRVGNLVGVLSVYFRAPQTFSERHTQLGDLLAHQAAELIESRARLDSIEQLNEQLSRRTTELEVSQQEMSRRAAELLEHDRNREEFLAALGHELRNPLAAIQNGLEIIGKPADDRSRHSLEVARRQTRHLARLVNDLLDLTRIKHGRLRLEQRPLDLNQSARAAVENVREQAARKGLTFDCDLPSEPVIVNADAARVAQILDNLLRNAVTCTERGGGTVTVRRDATYARVTVRDTGIGIDPGRRSDLFKPYQQHDDRERRGGLGLGLTVVRALVEAHGGEVGFRSDGPGTGSEFSFTIPMVATDAPGDTRVTVASAAASFRVLVVDDQQDSADMLVALLENLGQHARGAYSAQEALDIAREQRPQVAFLDLSMPDISGADLARRLRREFSEQELTLVAVSGYDRTHPKAREGAFAHHLLKPVTPEAIVGLLNSLAATKTPE